MICPFSPLHPLYNKIELHCIFLFLFCIGLAPQGLRHPPPTHPFSSSQHTFALYAALASHKASLRGAPTTPRSLAALPRFARRVARVLAGRVASSAPALCSLARLPRHTPNRPLAFSGLAVCDPSLPCGRSGLLRSMRGSLAAASSLDTASGTGVARLARSHAATGILCRCNPLCAVNMATPCLAGPRFGFAPVGLTPGLSPFAGGSAVVASSISRVVFAFLSCSQHTIRFGYTAGKQILLIY